MSFETLAQANRPDRFFSAFMYDGIVMPAYTSAEVREIVGALVRMAQIDKERDDREEFAALGADYLRACLSTGMIPMELGNTASVYYAGRRFVDAVSKLRGDALETWPEALYATDERNLFVSRRLFAAYARRAVRGLSTSTLEMQMCRCGWGTCPDRHRAHVAAGPATTPHRGRRLAVMTPLSDIALGGHDSASSDCHISLRSVIPPGDGSAARDKLI